MTKSPMHSHLASGRWFQLSLAEQLGNIGSEYERVLSAYNNQNFKRYDSAIDRLYELLCLSVVDPRWTMAQRREICRLKESVSETFFGDCQTEQSREGLRRYFYYFGVLARKGN